VAIPDRPTRIWITRTQPGADATAAKVRALGVEAIVAPVLQARPIADAAIDLTEADALAFTSGQGLRAFAALSPRRDLPAFCVGEATARLASSLGFEQVFSADGDVAALADMIAASEPLLRLVVSPGAREPVADLPALLTARGVAGRAVAVYETTPAFLPAPPVGVDAVMIHSAKAAGLAARLIGDGARAMTALVISEAAARSLRQLPFRRIAVAATPNEDSLLDLIRVDRNAGRTHEKP
jgi:uroporphyrinogen-III synthase